MPAVRAALAVGDQDAARAAADELQDTAVLVGNEGVFGLAAAAAASLAAAPGAVPIGRDAVRCFHEARLPIDEAENRLKLAAALLRSDDILGAQDRWRRRSAPCTPRGQRTPGRGRAPFTQITSPLNGKGPLTTRDTGPTLRRQQGLTNQQIDRLILSPHTVHRHVAHILTSWINPLGQPRVARAAVANDLM